MKKYKVIKQEPYTCVPACLQIILDKNNIEYESQKQIGNSLGLILPVEYKDEFNNVRVGVKPEAGYGTQIHKEEYSINNYFKNQNIPLKEEYYFISEIKDIEAFLNKNLIANDIIVCFNNNILFHDGNDYGHVALIEEYKNNRVTLLEVDGDIDFKEIELEELLEAIGKHGKDNRAGFWVISKI